MLGTLQRGATLRHEMLELLRVQLVVLDDDGVRSSVSANPVAAEETTQIRDGHLQALQGSRRRRIAPHGVDQLIDRHRRAGTEQERPQHRPRLASAERDRAAVHENCDRSENAELRPGNGFNPADNPYFPPS
jgi:hypothetical protein